VGERNVYALNGKGRIAALPKSQTGALTQIGAIFATGNVAIIEEDNPAAEILAGLPKALAARIEKVTDWRKVQNLAGLLVEGGRDVLLKVNAEVAGREGAILRCQAVSAAGLASGTEDYILELLLDEVSVSTNTAAAGGNASLMTIG
jgi:RHH-type proline utilization regulon transcriptional repressor/proline dehydrogenase/delta 1-pyrroline-5-carboxylate dehydrogenase